MWQRLLVLAVIEYALLTIGMFLAGISGDASAGAQRTFSSEKGIGAAWVAENTFGRGISDTATGDTSGVSVPVISGGTATVEFVLSDLFPKLIVRIPERLTFS